MNNNVALNRTMPVVILVLTAAVVALFGLYSVEKGRKFEGNAAINAKSEQQVFEWKMVTTWPKNFPGLGTTPERFARWVEKASEGRLKITVYGAGEIVPAMQVFDAVSTGAAEMGHGAAYYWTGRLAVAPFFTTVPFGMTAQEMNAWLHHGGGLELWQEAYEPYGVIPLAGGNTGVQMAGWFNREINSINDLKGLVMRIPGLAGEVFQRAGGTAKRLPGGEIYTSLQTGVIDATEWVGPYNDLSLGLHKVGKYYYYPGWHEPGPTIELMVNAKAWASLPDDLQEIVRLASRAANQDMLDEYTALNKAALTTLVEEHGVELRRLPDDVLAELKRLSAELLAERAAKDPFVNRVYSSYKEFADAVRDYHHISEQAYLEARD